MITMNTIMNIIIVIIDHHYCVSLVSGFLVFKMVAEWMCVRVLMCIYIYIYILCTYMHTHMSHVFVCKRIYHIHCSI